MQFLVTRQHLDKLLDAPCARFGAFGGLNPEQHGVPVGAVERGEEGARPRVAVESRFEIFRHGRGTERVVSRLPAAIFFRAIHLLQSGGLHTAAVISASAFSRLIFDQMLLLFRGVNRCSQAASLSGRFCASIQP